MIKELEMTEQAAGSMSCQLWRYYDIEADIQTTYFDYGLLPPDKYGIRRNLLRVFSDGGNCQYVTAKIFNHCIEDLYLVSPDNKLIEPTTTSEEQELR